ncbi:MAG: 30S ribosomal protein S9 [Acidimicrobiia bacterium]
MAEPPVAIATGRRKESVARVRLYDGAGSFDINGRTIDDYFPTLARRLRIIEAFRLAATEGRYDVKATIEGGGLTGQTDALRLGIARALVELNPELRPTLKKAGLLRRDARKVERKKYGLRKARRAPQYTKR